MNTRRKLALACAVLSVAITTLCLIRTTALTMMGLFTFALPLSLLGIAIYLFDLGVAVMKLRIKAERR